MTSRILKTFIPKTSSCTGLGIDTQTEIEKFLKPVSAGKTGTFVFTDRIKVAHVSP